MVKVLVTGGNSFVGVPTIKELVAKGCTVEATVRSEAKAARTNAILTPDEASKTTFRTIPDMTPDGAFDELMKAGSYDAVVHISAPFYYSFDKPSDMLDPHIKGTIGLLKSIKQYGSSIKSVVAISSFAAVFNPLKGAWPEHSYTEEDWNPITLEMATTGPPIFTYVGAKCLAEKAAWDFVDNEKPAFRLVTLTPPLVYGPVQQPVDSIKSLNQSSGELYQYLDGSLKTIPENIVFAWVDVRDVAAASVTAIERPEAKGRFLLAGGTHSNKEVASILRSAFPERAFNIPTKLHAGLAEDGYPAGGVYSVSTAKSKEILEMKYRGLKESLVDFVRSIEPLEAKA